MKIILVINDNSPAATHAAEFAFMLAQQQNADIIIANTVVNKHKVVEKLELSYTGEDTIEAEEFPPMANSLLGIRASASNFLSGVKEIDISNSDECALAELINRNKVWMIVKGTSATIAKEQVDQQPKVHIVLNKINCPLLLIPEYWPLKVIEGITYISDLRYSRIEIIRYLAEFAKLSKANLSFAHLTAKGLPDMSDEYALNLFTEEICRNVKYDKLFFNNIKKREFIAAIDVMINGIKSDMLAFANHHFHIEEILGYEESRLCSAPITVPVLIFPY